MNKTGPDLSLSDYDFQCEEHDSQRGRRQVADFPLSSYFGEKPPIDTQKKMANIGSATKDIREKYYDDFYSFGNNEQLHEKGPSAHKDGRQSVDLKAVYKEIAEINAKLKVCAILFNEILLILQALLYIYWFNHRSNSFLKSGILLVLS